MISIVNGFVCYSCCDAAKAKRGEDPAKKLGELDSQQNNASCDPAVTFGNALKDASGSAAVNGVASITASANGTALPATSQQNIVDVLA